MSQNEISKMSVKERIALMEELWASFERDGLDYPVPAWHEELLNERAKKDDSHFLSFDKVKKSLQEDLNAYRNS
jgi:putative addiction module component (TIGR02574 family)